MVAEVSKARVLTMLYEKGYEIIIEQRNNIKYVSFNGKYSKEQYKVQHQYSTDWSDEQIRFDVVFDLLKWTGLRSSSNIRLLG